MSLAQHLPKTRKSRNIFRNKKCEANALRVEKTHECFVYCYSCAVSRTRMLRVYIAITVFGLAGDLQVASTLNQETQMTQCLLSLKYQQVQFRIAEHTLLEPISAQQAKESTSLRTTLNCGAHFTINYCAPSQRIQFIQTNMNPDKQLRALRLIHSARCSACSFRGFMNFHHQLSRTQGFDHLLSGCFSAESDDKPAALRNL